MTDARAKGPRRWSTALLIVATMLGLYVLSIGPMLHIAGLTSWYSIYRPLLVAARNPQVGRPLAAYVNVWASKSFQATQDRQDGIEFVDDFTIDGK